MSNTKIHLVIIDPQNDFTHPEGALSVPGAQEDMARLKTFVNTYGDRLHDISVTLDSHHRVDIAHNIMWKNEKGERPQPFTIITKDDVESGRWTTAIPSFHKRALEYVTKLEENGRYPLCIWPDHCLIGSWGHNVDPQLFESLLRWEDNFAMVNYVTKGSNMWTEHYSALKADVPDPADQSTQINTGFVRALEDSDYIVIAGEASSHCVANTVRDIADALGEEYVSKMVILKDAMSPVPGFENLEEDFFKEMSQKGMKITTTTEFLK